MAVSSVTSIELDVDAIVRRAYQLAGLMGASEGPDSPNWNPKAAMARDFLEVEVESLQASGILVRAVDFYDVTLTDATNPYTVDSTTLDLVGDASYLQDGETDGWTPVRMVTREEYVALSNRITAGRPTLFYPHRGSTFQVYLWPVPDTATESLGTLRFQRHRLLASSTEGGATMDLERHWQLFLMYSLAHKLALASTLPIDRCGYLDSRAQREFDRAKLYSRQRAPQQFMHVHRSGVSRR